MDFLGTAVTEKYTAKDESGRAYQLTSLLNPNPDRPNLRYEFLGVTRVWRWTREPMEEARTKMDRQRSGKIRHPHYAQTTDRRATPAQGRRPDLPRLRNPQPRQVRKDKKRLKIAAKVVDIFGNHTMTIVDVAVGGKK